MSNWIFVIKDTKAELEQRIKNGMWPIYKNTRYKNRLQKGDKVIFYMAGPEGRKFLGAGLLASKSKPTEKMDFSVALDSAKIWKKPVHVNTVLEHLKFITNKSHWGIHFQGGVILLSDEDYEFLLSKAS